MSGGAIVLVSEKIIAKGKKLAAHLLEASEADMEFKDGRFTIAGTDRALGIHEIGKTAFQLDKLGTVINPMLVKGQIMGGIAQGLGQALMEEKTYDRETGPVLAGSFMDYAMPRADDFCEVEIEDNPVPTPTNPLGVKGAGEAGTVGSVYGIRHIDMPCTPYRVWRAIEKPKKGSVLDAEGGPAAPHHTKQSGCPRSHRRSDQCHSAAPSRSSGGFMIPTTPSPSSCPPTYP